MPSRGNQRNCVRTVFESARMRTETHFANYREEYLPDVFSAIPLPCNRCRITASDGRQWCVGPSGGCQCTVWIND
jgi:hypothetical protein